MRNLKISQIDCKIYIIIFLIIIGFQALSHWFYKQIFRLVYRIDFGLPIWYWLTLINPAFECNFWNKKCKIKDIFVPIIGPFGLFELSNFRPCKIGKSWIASGFCPRSDMKSFRPNVLLKGTRSVARTSPLTQANKKEPWKDSFLLAGDEAVLTCSH